MQLKTKIIRWYAKRVTRATEHDANHAVQHQDAWMQKLVKKAANTSYGKKHAFQKIQDYESFKASVPIVDYEGIKEYIEEILSGQENVLWPGRPTYLAKTSGTTSGIKYIPITKDSVSNHFGTARNALFNYLTHADHFEVFNGKLIFFSGSPALERKEGLYIGRLSGIVNHQVPSWLQSNKLPSYATNCIEDWEAKLDAIIDELIGEDLRLIGGIPPWVQMFYEKIIERTGKQNMKQIFPAYSVFVHGGVNYEPYRNSLTELVGKPIYEVETYPASEGFIAFQNTPTDDSLLLNVNSGIFFEFIPVAEAFDDHPTRLKLDQVALQENYALIINSNAGLWGYSIGDTVQFTSLAPYKIKVTGRIKHFISAFGEHVIGKEVDEALSKSSEAFGIKVIEFTVAPQVNPSKEEAIPYHEWFIEFDQVPQDMQAFAQHIDQLLQDQNIYYADLIRGNILQTLKIRAVQRGGFISYMKSIGKLGEQNKVPRLKNDRSMADPLKAYLINT